MVATPPAVDGDALQRSRALIERRPRRERMWPVLAAAGALAASALVFATVMIASPPLTTQHPGHARSVE